MKAWILRRGRLLGWVSLSAMIAAVVAPVIAMAIAIISTFGGAPYSSSPLQVALVVGGVLAGASVASGIAVWAVRAPGYEFGIAAIVVLGAILLIIGGILVMLANPDPGPT